MKILNVRGGFATNSSSTHSLLLLPPGIKASDDVDGGHFGWDFFTAASREAKLDYLGEILRGNLEAVFAADWQDDTAREARDAKVAGIVAGLIGMEPKGDGVDHQSEWVLPRSWDGQGLDADFVRDLMIWMMQDRLAILGGNDNTDQTHPLEGPSASGFQLPLERDRRSAVTVARRDDLRGGYWVVFSRDHGNKVRFRFDTVHDRQAAAPDKSTWPELVDVKITDWCDAGCSYCYQGSTVRGQHADLDWITRLADGLASMRVFEVALGGGEPTAHPHFQQILNVFRNRGVVPNFTTKSLTWLDGPGAVDILDTCGTFAYSCDTGDEVRMLARHLDAGTVVANLGGEHRSDVVWRWPRPNVHHVLGSQDIDALPYIVRACHKAGLQLVLLGFKDQERGHGHKVYPHDGWIDAVRSALSDKSYVRVAIDTVLASRYQDQLRAKGVPQVMFTVREGAFSCYVDAVGKTVAPSSFCDRGMYRPVAPDAQSLTMAYGMF